MSVQGRLDAALESALSEDRIAGAVLLVSEDGQPVYERAVGQADRQLKSPMTIDARFRLASVTKPVSTALFMTLVEDGTLDLRMPVGEVLPEFGPKLRDGSQPRITLHHLLTHSSGLGYRFLENESSPYAIAEVSDGLDQPGLTMSENLARLNGVPLHFEPGTGWRYSLGLDVMGAVAEVATGKSLQSLLDDRIAGPLELGSLAFHVTRDEGRLVTPYFNSETGPRLLEDGMRIPLWEDAGVTFAPSRVHDARSFPSCGAGLVGTAPDLMKFFNAVLSGGSPILAHDTVKSMMTNQLPEGLHTLHGPGWGFGYGWGVLVQPQGPAAHLPRGLLRWGGVYGHSWFIDPAAGRVSVLLTNTSFEGMGGRLPEDIMRAFYT